MRKFNVKKAVAGVSAAALIFTAGTVIPSYQNVNFVSSITASAASYGDSIVSAAKKDVGKSRSSVGCGTYGDWCALYATTKAKNAGVNLDYCKYPTYCSELVYDFINKGIYHSKAKTTHKGSQSGRSVDCSKAYDGNYVPKPGDLIFFNWDGASEPQPDHVGIVEYVEGNRVYTIEGNSTGDDYKHDPNNVNRNWWTMTNSVIHGYVSFDGTSSPVNPPAVNPVRTSGTTTYQFTSPVAFRNVTYPINQPAGGTFNVYGKLSTADNSKITKITVDIDEYRNGSYYNVDRTVRYPNTTTYDLHTIDDRIWFNRASKKNTTYRYRIIVEANGKTCIHSKSFKTF